MLYDCSGIVFAMTLCMNRLNAPPSASPAIPADFLVLGSRGGDVRRYSRSSFAAASATCLRLAALGYAASVRRPDQWEPVASYDLAVAS